MAKLTHKMVDGRSVIYEGGKEVASMHLAPRKKSVARKMTKTDAANRASIKAYDKAHPVGGTSTFKKQSRATRESHQLPSNNKLRSKKYQRNETDYY